MKEAFPSHLVFAEVQERGEMIATLEQLDGYKRMSEKQKQFLLLSLYVQQRAERGTDPVSASRIQEVPPNFKNLPREMPYITSVYNDGSTGSGDYHTSQLYIMSEFCHKAVKDLEAYGTEHNGEAEWIEAGPVRTYDELCELLHLADDTVKFPLVLEAWVENPGSNPMYRSHTALVLGKNGSGEYMVWEKVGFNLPFQVTSLKQVYDIYDTHVGWRVRELRV